MAQIHPEFFHELPRYRRLKQSREYFNSKQYDGRADFFTGKKPGSSEVVPLAERKPCVIYPLAKSAVNQVVRFTFGESRFPSIGIDKIDPDEAVAGEKLSEEDAKTLEKFVAALIEACGLKPTMRRVMRPGLAVGTSCVILSLVRGKIEPRIANAEDLLCEFRDADPAGEVLSAQWCYRYTDSVPDAQGHPQPKQFWFRQDINEREFIEYERVEVKTGERPIWRESRKVAHDFGFCPVVWIRNISDADSKDLDGTSLYDGLLEEFDALNFALSQRHRGIRYWGTPQPWETGVEDDDGPAANARKSRGGYSPAGTAFNPANDQSPHGAVAESPEPARKLSPESMWSYKNEKAEIGLLETTGKSFEAATNHVNDIRGRTLEAMSVVLVNVSEIMNRTSQNQMSAKFLELAYEPLLALVDEMRHCWWPYGLKAILSAALRIVAIKNGKGIYIPGAAKAAKILRGFFIKTSDGTTLWMPPKMTPVWGDYFSAGPEEIEKAVDAAAKAKNERLVPEEDAVKYVLPYFGREDAAVALEEIEDDKAEAMALAQQAADTELTSAHAAVTRFSKKTEADPPEPKPSTDDAGAKKPRASRARGGGKSKGAARGGSRDAAPSSAET